MAVPVIMPRSGQSVESCIISKWYKRKGDNVKAGDILFTYETDKATFDEEAKVDGTILEIFFEEGDDVPVLTNVCVIGSAGENVVEFDPRIQSKQVEAQKTPVPDGEGLETGSSDGSPADLQAEAHVKEISQAAGAGVKISPRAKNLAEKIGVDYNAAVPTGPYGRIIERDILSLREAGAAATPSAKTEYVKSVAPYDITGTGLGGMITTDDLKGKPEDKEVKTSLTSVSDTVPIYEEVKLTNIRKLIAKSMHQSLANSAQLTLNSSFDASDILAFRKKLKEGKIPGCAGITLNDMVLYAVSRTLMNHKALNAHFLEDKMLLLTNVNLGVAVDTPRGLMVPTVFNANLKSLKEISAEVKKLADECQKGTISPDSLKGGSFTVTNLGALGIESFTPVLNPPQVGILGVCSITQRVKEINGQYSYYPAMGLSLTFDHRAVDGAPAARFLQELKANLENFTLLLAV